MIQSSGIRMKRKRSELWNFFEPIDSGLAICNICKTKLSYKTSTSNLKKHITTRHPTINFGSTDRGEENENAEMEKFMKGKKSIVWKYFTPESEIKARCNMCDHSLSYKSSITNLNKHLIRKHQSEDIINEVKNIELKLDPDDELSYFPEEDTNLIDDESDYNFVNKEPKLEYSQEDMLNEKLLCMVTTDLQPISIVQDEGFRNFCYALDPSYVLPSKMELSNSLSEKFAEMLTQTREIIAEAKSVTISIDSWTTSNEDTCLAVVANFIDKNFYIKSFLLEVISSSFLHFKGNLSDELRRVTSEWGIENKILLGISKNIDKEQFLTEELNWEYFNCLAHAINSIVQKALLNVKPLLVKLNTFIVAYNQSNLTNNETDFLWEENPNWLNDLDSSKWNLVYTMLKKIDNIKEELRAFSTVSENKSFTTLNNEEINYVGELVDILAPMESTIAFMSNEKHVTLSSVIIITNGLRDLYNELMNNNMFSELTKNVLKNIWSEVHTQFKHMETNSTLQLSTFLDPRFKHIGFSQTTFEENAKLAATKALDEIIVQSTEVADVSSTTDTEVLEKLDNKRMSIWNSFDKKASIFDSSGNKKSITILEIERYLEAPLLQRFGDPMEWWRSQAYNYPYLSELVRLKFGVVATSEPCERMYSKAGHLFSIKRSCIAIKDVNKIMFINQNKNYLDFYN